MTLTHAQLLDAARAAGRDRESFTCADVRQQLGLSTADRKQMNRFYSRFRALQQGGASEIEKLSKDCYRLRAACEPAIAVPIVEAEPAHDEALALAEPAHAEVVTPAEPAAHDEALALAEPAHAEVVTPAEPLPSLAELVALAAPLPSAAEALPQRAVQAEVSLATACAEAASPSPGLAPARPAPVPKPRAPWLSRMASFFTRRGAKNDVAPGVAVGA